MAFVDYTKSPEAQFPVAIEQGYKALCYVNDHAKELNVNAQHLMIGGDSVGGNMALVMNLLAQERKGPTIQRQVIFYPVTNADMNTASYQEFAEGPWLTKKAMEWFWDAYEPDVKKRDNPLMSPLKASMDQLKHFPKTLLITDENDVLRDEGEAFARRLMQAGVEVRAARFLGTIHDFVMINAITQSPASRGAVQCACNFFKKQFNKPSV
jgi:acetyl esterase